MSSQASPDPWPTTPADPKIVLDTPPARAEELGLKPGDQLGSYELLAQLGKGGMGLVFRARHVLLRKDFALKVLSPRLARDDEAVQRFHREMTALGRLEDAHLVRASDAGVLDGVPFLVMELLDGTDLAKWTQQLGRWPVAEACEATRQAALGLQHAYEQDLVHRDIKPSNLLLTRSGVVKVLDLGLARLCDGDATAMTAAGVWMGTPDYIAPEQILDSHTADIRADLYSLGCTLFLLLSGEPPFSSATHPTLRQKNEAHLKEPPPDIRQRRPEVPAELAAVLARLLAKQPEDRYQTPAEAAVALEPSARNAHLESLWGGGLPSTVEATTRSDAATTTSPSGPAATARSTRRHPRHTDPFWRRGRWIAAIMFLTAGVGLTAVLFQRVRSPSASVVVPDKVQVRSLDVKHFATVNGHSAPPRRLGEEVFVTHVDDSVTVDARLSRPAYAFVIAFRPDGTPEVCFPEKDDEPPPLTDRPRYPSESTGFNYGLEEGAGLQAFALVVSSQPLPSFKDWWSQTQGCPWKKSAAPPNVVWRADGIEDVEALTADPEGQRAKGRQVEGKTPVAELAAWLRQTPGVEAVRVLGFAVMPKEKR
jgi:serine/threonine protein kinase